MLGDLVPQGFRGSNPLPRTILLVELRTAAASLTAAQMPRESIRERAAYVYAPSVQMLDDWVGRANKSHAPLSKFVLEHVNNSIRQEDAEEN
jgi:hypothetical protein